MCQNTNNFSRHNNNIFSIDSNSSNNNLSINNFIFFSGENSNNNISNNIVFNNATNKIQPKLCYKYSTICGNKRKLLYETEKTFISVELSGSFHAVHKKKA